MPHAAAVTRAGGVATGEGGAGTSRLPARPVYHAPPSHLWTPPDYVDLVSDDDDNGGH